MHDKSGIARIIGRGGDQQMRDALQIHLRIGERFLIVKNKSADAAILHLRFFVGVACGSGNAPIGILAQRHAEMVAAIAITETE